MKFKKWMDENKKTTAEVAQAIGCSEMNVFRYCSGTTIPRPENMQKIIAYTGGEVQPNDFYKGDE